MNKTIVWIVGTLTMVGGGEHLLFEGVNHYRSLGYRVRVITWAFDKKALFDGKYSDEDIMCLDSNWAQKGHIFRRAVTRFLTLFAVRREIKKLNPEFVIAQSEYDAITCFLTTLGTTIPYKILIFGQTFQFPDDWAKYTKIFRHALKEIVTSVPGYRDTIPIQPPKISIINQLAMETICTIRYFAIKRAKTTFVFSKQVRWEVEKLYNRASVIAKGAFGDDIFLFKADRTSVLNKFDVAPSQIVFLSLSRLVPKKRVDLCIEAFCAAKIPNSTLLIGGTGPDELRLKTLASKIGEGSDIRFLGYVHSSDVWPLKQACDVFVSLDIADYDITSVEALALGSKVIWTDEIDVDVDPATVQNLFVCGTKGSEVVESMHKAASSSKKSRDGYLDQLTWASYFNRILTS